MLTIRHEHEVMMQEHVEACLPEEGCGLIGGTRGDAELVLPVTNVEHSTVRFEMDGREMFDAFLAFEAAELELIAIFHSHPNGPPEPSETDMRTFMYPGVITLILSKQNSNWQVNAYRISGDSYQQVEIRRV